MSMVMFSQPRRRGRPIKFVPHEEHRKIEANYLRSMDVTLEDFMRAKKAKRNRESVLGVDIDPIDQI